MSEEAKTAATAEEEEEEVHDGYQVAKKVDLATIVNQDAEDESLRRYKEQLLGAAVAGGAAASTDPRHVVIEEVRLAVEGREDIVVPLSSAEQVEVARQRKIVLKEGTPYRVVLRFRVQHDVVLGLKMLVTVTRAGLRVGTCLGSRHRALPFADAELRQRRADKQTHVVGSFPPREEPQEFALPPEVAPKGMLMRGDYRARCKARGTRVAAAPWP